MATTAMRGIEDALPIAERFGDDLALAHARSTLGFALAHRDTDAERDRGQKLLAEVSDVFLRRVYLLCELPIVNIYVARERARRGDDDLAAAEAEIDRVENLPADFRWVARDIAVTTRPTGSFAIGIARTPCEPHSPTFAHLPATLGDGRAACQHIAHNLPTVTDICSDHQ
jgi:hypothetical protein